MDSSESFTALTDLFTHRIQTLIPLLVAGFFAGELLAQYLGVNYAFTALARTARLLVKKLNRPNRGIATRLYRGMVAMLMLLIPAIILGVLISRLPPIVTQLLMVAFFGHAFATFRLYKRYRRARATILPLELPEIDFLFADSHAVLRYSILSSAEAFAVGGVGASFWYILGGLPLALTYLVLTEIAAAYREPVFGWAANALMRLLDFIPHLFTIIFLTLAAIFVPRARPFAVARAKRYHGFIAYLLNVSLGGALPNRQLTWEGTGTPKLLPEHLARWLLVRLAATVLLLMALAAPQLIKILNLIN